jgi:hypothetical protein
MRPYHDGMRAYVQNSLFVYMRVPVSLDTRSEAYATVLAPSAAPPCAAGEASAILDLVYPA